MLERLQIIVDAATGGAVRDLEMVGATATKVGVQTDAMTAKANTASGAFSGLRSSSALLWGGLAIGAIGISKAVTTFAELGTEVRAFRDISGTTADEASRWVAVMDDYEIATDGGARAVSKLAREAGAGGEAIGEFGVKVEHAKDGGVDLQETLLNVADAYAASHDPAAKAQLLTAAFGKTGRDLIPILEQGRDGIRDMFAAVPSGQLFSDKDLDLAREFKLALDDLKDVGMELGVAIGRVAIGPLTGAMSVISGVTRVVTGLDGVLGTSAVSAGIMGSAVGGLAFGLGPLGMVAAGVGTALASVIGEMESLEENISGQLLEALGSAKRGTEEYEAILQALKEVHGEDVAAANLHAEGERRLAEELMSATERARELTAALREQVLATLGVEGALLTVESRTTAYASAVYQHGAASYEARNAENALKEALLAVAPAIQATADANRDGTISAAEQAVSTQAQISQLSTLAGTLSPGSALRVFLDSYIAELRGVPKGIHTTITADVSQALATLSALQAKLGEVNAGFGVITPQGVAASRGIRTEYNLDGTPRAHGGPLVPGVPYTFGEQGTETAVFSQPGYMYPHGTSPGGGGSQIIINIEGSVIHESDLQSLFVDALAKASRDGNLQGLELRGVTVS